MNFTYAPSVFLLLAAFFGTIFGFLLHRGGVANYNVIVNQFRLKDFTVLKIMLTAILVGGVGVAVMVGLDVAQYHIKPANMLGVSLGAALFGIGMVLYGYCPGTAVAAIGGGSVHAAVGAIGMLIGAASYAYSYSWVSENVLNVAALGKVRLTEVTSLPSPVWFFVVLVMLFAVRRYFKEVGNEEQ